MRRSLSAPTPPPKDLGHILNLWRGWGEYNCFLPCDGSQKSRDQINFDWRGCVQSPKHSISKTRAKLEKLWRSWNKDSQKRISNTTRIGINLFVIHGDLWKFKQKRFSFPRRSSGGIWFNYNWLAKTFFRVYQFANFKTNSAKSSWFFWNRISQNIWKIKKQFTWPRK